MIIGFTNTEKINFCDRLKYLYGTIDIDTDSKGWSVKVARMLFDNGICEYSYTSDGLNEQTEVQTQANERGNVGRVLEKHIKVKDASKIDTKYIMIYCSLFGCSSDYLLGFINTPLHTAYDDVPLKHETINALKRIRANYFRQGFATLQLAVHGIERQPYQPVDMLNFVLCNPHFEDMLYTLEDYIKPDYCIPMFYMDGKQDATGKAHYHIPHNPIHEKPVVHKDGTPVLDDNNNPVYDRYLPLVKDITCPTDYRPIPIDSAFLEGVAFREIEKHIEGIKSDYIKQRKKR